MATTTTMLDLKYHSHGLSWCPVQSPAGLIPHPITSLHQQHSAKPKFIPASLRAASGQKLGRRTLVFTPGIVACASAAAVVEVPAEEMEKLPFKTEGYNYWSWRNHKVHYVVQGEGPAIVLIHGFGASAFHWRYNIPALAKHFRVYAMDLLGFGWSDKALIEYEPTLWRDQVADFVKDVVKEKAVLVGNSIGGITVLNTAANYPDLISGLVLLNASGQFDDPTRPKKEVAEETTFQKLIVKPIRDWFQRIAIGFTYWQARQPERIKSVLNSVYIDKKNVDDYLVDSIVQPTKDPNSGEVYYRLMSRYLFQPGETTINQLLAKLSCPLLLLWGDLDPWMGASKADKIKSLYPQSSLVRLQAGHCPHDEAPELVNNALIEWATSIK